MKKLSYFVSLTLIVSILFTKWPKIDVLFSNIFFSSINKKFYFENNKTLYFIGNLAYFFMSLLLIYNIFSIIRKTIHYKLININLFKKEVIFLLTFFIGSTLVIQGFMKHYFGRPRPIDIINFGGSKDFIPAYHISSQCKYNCSFVSFHTSIGVLLIIFSLERVNKIRKKLATFSCLFLGCFGLTRILQGRHFLSDVIISAYIITIIYYIISYIYNKVINYPR